ncbi:exported hypothetical protein [Gammaproteobacteria bacterium]
MRHNIKLFFGVLMVAASSLYAEQSTTNPPTRIDVPIEDLKKSAQSDPKVMGEASMLGKSSVSVQPSAVTNALDVAVTQSGNFTCGVSNGPILLYGHPHPWSSGTTIRVDGLDHYNFNRSTFGNEVTPPTNIDSVTNQGVWDIGDVRLVQTLKIVKGGSGNLDTLKISYRLTNRGSSNHSAGVRILLDTMLGQNDGAPFRVPAVGEVTYERELIGSSVPMYWEAFEDLTNPSSLKARGTLVENGSLPDRLVFAYWRHAYGSQWDYAIDPSVLVTGDSSVMMYWNPITLSPGQSVTRTTYYGLSDVSTQPGGEVALSTLPELSLVNGSYAPNPFPVTVYVSNTGSATLTGLTAELALSTGLVLGSESLTQRIQNIEPSDTGQATWQVRATGTVTGPLVIGAAVVGDNFPRQSTQTEVLVPALPVPSQVALAGSPNPVTLGENVVFTASVSPQVQTGTPPVATGTITFSVDGSIVATVSLVSGQATYSTSDLVSGNHVIGANYSGNRSYQASSTQLTEVVSLTVQTTTTLSASGSATYGAPLTLTAAVTPSVGTSGVVEFVEASALLACAQNPVPLSKGVATCVVSNLGVGNHMVMATYGGDSNHSSSMGAFTQVIAKANQTITFRNPGNQDYSSTPFPLDVTSSSGLAVLITSATPAVCTVDKNLVTTVSAGTCTLLADQSGNGNYNPASQVKRTFLVTTKKRIRGDLENWLPDGSHGYPTPVIQEDRDGIRIQSSGGHAGVALLARHIYDLRGANLYVKWMVIGGPRYTQAAVSVNTPMTSFGCNTTTDHSTNGSLVIPQDVWLYTHFQLDHGGAITQDISTGNYQNQGGKTVVSCSGQLNPVAFSSVQSSALIVSLNDDSSDSNVWIKVGEARTTGKIVGSLTNVNLIGALESSVTHGTCLNDGMVAWNSAGGVFEAGKEEDRLYGDPTANILVGGEGEDLLIGGGGNDMLTGGKDADLFFYYTGGIDQGIDTITDFSDGDKIRIEGAAFSGHVSVGNGSEVEKNQVQMHFANGVTTLYIGTNAKLGADLVIQLTGEFKPGNFVLIGRDIKFKTASSPESP